MMPAPLLASKSSAPSASAAGTAHDPQGIAALAQALASDTPGALAAAWTAFGPLVRSVVTRVLGAGSPWIADAEQATFLLLWRRRSQLERHPQLAGWCHATATRIASDLRRRERRLARREEVSMDQSTSASATDAAHAVDADTAAALDGAIQRLPHASRAVVVGLYMAGEDRGALAARLGISDDALRQRLSDGLERLRRLLRPVRLGEASLLALLREPAAAAGDAPAWMADPARAFHAVPARVRALARSTIRWRVMSAIATLLTLAAIAAVATHLVRSPSHAASASPSVHAAAQAPTPVAASDDPLPPGPPSMLGAAQAAQQSGGLVVLWSRNRWGNYPLATYDFRLGLRGDHPHVANGVQLAFGNRQRANAWTGAQVDAVADVPSNGSCGQDGGPGAQDEFRANLYGGERSAIRDLGAADFAAIHEARPIGFDEAVAPVVVGHTYLVMYQADGEPGAEVKMRVLAHRDNDAVLIEWAPLPLPAATPRGID
jgi:RNA polymerase sigma factor (sigma-70 family)